MENVVPVEEDMNVVVLLLNKILAVVHFASGDIANKLVSKDLLFQSLEYHWNRRHWNRT